MDDRVRVRALLGREPQGRFDVVMRDADGDPVVIRNDPLLDDGTPMPTRYWLIGRNEVAAVSRLESGGGIAAAVAELDPDAVADAHRRYAAERDAHVPPGHLGPRPAGGVGGTRRGIKCLHAHYAWFLAGGDDPVGRWVAAALAEGTETGIVAARLAEATATSPPSVTIELGAESTIITTTGHDPVAVPIGPATLVDTELSGGPDPPAPAQLTNALGAVADHLDDAVRAQPQLLTVSDVRFAGPDPWHLAAVERGGDVPGGSLTLTRAAADDLFRTLATESVRDRLHNPGLQPDRVDTVLGTCCIVLAVMRRLHLAHVTLQPAVHE